MTTDPATATTPQHASNAEHDDIEDNEEDEQVETNGHAPTSNDAKKKKKKKKPKKKPKFELQTDPPRTGLSKIYTTGVYPEGEIQHYTDDNAYRLTSEEKRYNEKLIMEDPEQTYANIRKAAEVHRTVRKAARQYIKPGMTMTEIAEYIEDGTRALVEENRLDAGIAFPTGLSRNHCAAHYSPNPGDSFVLKHDDVLKVDFGVHVKGQIIDSAFTLTFEPTYNRLLEAVQAATNAGIKAAGIDARLGEVGAIIQETMESYEVEVNGKTYPVKSIENLSGHSINPYQIHGGKSVLLVANDDQTKMEEGDHFAIETFGSTGRGRVLDSGECSHYARIFEQRSPQPVIRLATAKSLLKTINQNFGTLPFCRRYLSRLGEKNYLYALDHLVKQGIVQDYPPLCDTPGSMTAQFEHTILLRPTCKEVLSRGDDY